MSDKQNRYRTRKSEQGIQRVEVLIPKALAPLLKAYARALRDAHSLGMEPPLFDGMNGRPAPQEIAPAPSGSIASHQNSRPNEKPKEKKPDFSKGLF